MDTLSVTKHIDVRVFLHLKRGSFLQSFQKKEAGTLKTHHQSEFTESASNLTIFILTFNRPRALARQLFFLRNFPGQIIVLDGSDEKPVISQDQLLPKKLLHIKGKTFQERFQKGAELLRTDYAMTFSDDDILVPTGINELLSKIACGENESVFGRTVYAYPLKNSWGVAIWSPLFENLKNRKVSGLDPETRVMRHFSNYSCVYFFSIMTSDAWKKTFSVLKLPNENMNINPYALELAYEFMGALTARSEIHNVLSAVRVKDFKPTWLPSGGTLNRSLLMSEWLNQKEFEKDVANYKYGIIAAAKNITQEIDIKFVLEEALNKYSINEQNHFSGQQNSVTRRRKFTKSNLKIFLDVVLIKLGLGRQISKSKSAKIYDELRSHGIVCDRMEIESIIYRLFSQ
jgi:glycosyltransferase domain-containing protein